MSVAPLQLLSGVRILSITQFLVGPAAVQYLSDLGAEVIKIESPRGAFERGWAGGDTFLNGISVFYLLSHRNTRSLTLDLKAPAAEKVVRKLIEDSDVLVENFRPGVLSRFGLDYSSVASINPRIIYASASGFGQDGPYRSWPGQDLILQALSGITSITGRDGDYPTPAGAAIVDQHCAALLAMAIAAALVNRERTGEGQRIETTLFQAALDLQLEPIVYRLNGSKIDRPDRPLGSAFHAAPYGTYETRDGYIVLSMSPVARIAEALGSPPELEPFGDPGVALSQKEDIHQALQDLLLEWTQRDLIELFQTHGIWCAPVRDYEDLFEDPGFKHLDPILEMEHPDAGTVKVLKHPVRFSSGEAVVRKVPPGLGEDTNDILREAGFSDDQIDELRASGTV